VAGVFVTDAGNGYPPGTPLGTPPNPSWHESIHGLASVLVFFGLPVAMVVMARRFRAEGSRWALYCWLSAVGVLVFFFASLPSTDLAGLLQRVAILLALGWVAQVMWRFAGSGGGPNAGVRLSRVKESGHFGASMDRCKRCLAGLSQWANPIAHLCASNTGCEAACQRREHGSAGDPAS
jgi:Protein of unknown function (DUF998)